MAAPQNYNELLSELGKRTACTTLVFLIMLRYFEVIPKITMDSALIPPIKDHQELVNWVVSFGLIPIAGAVFAWLLSSVFEVHNQLSKLIQFRYLWDKAYIAAPLLKKAGKQQVLDRQEVRNILYNFYYKEVKEIDQHYVQVFWRYALHFWVLFEHLLVSIIATVVVGIGSKQCPYELLIYTGVVFAVTAVHWRFVTVKKTLDQVAQIPEEKIRSYFGT
jgi:hypothetical protein